MSFQWPAMLGLLVLVAAMVAFYVWALRRHPRHPVRHTQVGLLALAVAQGGRWHRHLPAGLFGLSLVALVIAIARPIAPLPAPDNRTTVMLSIDVSRSMLADDMPPSRLEAAKVAAKEFVQALPNGMKVGVVTFSSFATLIVPPTADRRRVLEAIDLLTVESATAIGDGLLEALWALPGRVRPTQPYVHPHPPQEPVLPGTVVLLSDGQSNRGTVPQDAAQIAREQQVKVYTVGIGTPEGTFLTLGGRSIWVRLDEDTLREVAEITGGLYFRVTRAMELRQVYARLGRVVGWESKPTEVSAIPAAVAALLATGALAVSLLRVNRFS